MMDDLEVYVSQNMGLGYFSWAKIGYGRMLEIF